MVCFDMAMMATRVDNPIAIGERAIKCRVAEDLILTTHGFTSRVFEKPIREAVSQEAQDKQRGN